MKTCITKDYTQTPHWDDVTIGEVGAMVREAIKCGEQAIAEEARKNGEAHQNAQEPSEWESISR